MFGLEFAEKVLWKLPTDARMEGYGLFIGVRARSNELITFDRETNDINYVRTVRSVPLEQQWSADILEWARVVPWNRGEEDDDANADFPEFDVRQGPGRRLTPGEMEQMATLRDPVSRA